MSEATSVEPVPSDLQRGEARFSQLLGDHAAPMLDHMRDIAPDFIEQVLEWEYGRIYDRPGLDLRSREIAVLAACAAIGSPGLGPLKAHVRAAARVGINRVEVQEILMQVSFAAGVPIALQALEAAHQVFADIDREDASIA
jgi:4-carboxymuconolactone decarboxylase